MKSPFSRPTPSQFSFGKSPRRRTRRERAGAPLASEQLEQRSMLAIVIAGGGPVSNYAIIASDQASDVYVRQTVGGTLQVANNSSFLGDPIPLDPSYELESVAAADILYVTNGRAATGPGPMYRGDNRSAPVGPGYQADAVQSATTFFSLSNGNIHLPRYDLDAFGFRIPVATTNPNPFPSEQFQISNVIQGELRYDADGNGTVERWQFEIGPTGQVFFREATRITGNVAIGSTTITGLSSTAGFQLGMTVLGRGLPANAQITSIAGPTSVVISAPATATINGGSLDFVPLTPAVVQPVSGQSSLTVGEVTRGGRGEGLRGTLTVGWTAPVATVPDPGATPGFPDPPVISSIAYTYDSSANFFVDFTPWTDINLVPSSTRGPVYRGDIVSPPGFPLPGEVEGGIIPGTFSGTVTFDDDVISGNAASPATKGLGALGFTTDLLGGGTLYFGNETFGDIDWLRVRGTVASAPPPLGAPPGTPWSFTISLSFTNRYATNSAGVDTVGVNPGTVRIGGVSFLRYVQDPNPNSFTVFAGHDVTSQLWVEYGTVDSTVNIDSRVIVATPGAASNIADVSISATNINISSQVASQDSFSLSAETVRIEAAVAAPDLFNLSVSNNPFNDGTGGPLKGRLQLSPSASLSGALSPTLASVSTPTAVINVSASQADIYAESIVYGTKQDWLMQSSQYVAGLAPYELTTRSSTTGVDTGLIRGDTVAILLANDAPTPLDPSIAFNTLDLNTQVDSLRIKAATRHLPLPAPPTPSASGPFPYNLTIRESDDINLDAVAASGLPLSIRSGGNMRFTSSLATASDLTLQAVSDGSTPARLTVSAPLSTTKGQIRLVADGVAVNDGVRVSAADEHQFRDDIVIRATAGDVLVNGLVSAVNRVKIEQSNPFGPTESPYDNRNSLPIPDNSTVTQTIVVSDDFTFDNLDVVVDITHPFVGDLSATLVAPDGRRFQLFNRIGNAGDNFTDTIFDSEATVSITQGVAPYTGRFRPIQSLQPLYGGSALGTWQLEVQDAATRDIGTLNLFGLRFQTQKPQEAKVFGPARIVADALLLDVAGAVGDSRLLPADTNFFLRTDVNSLSGTIAGSASVDELNDIDIPSLRSGGFVSLRANGVDPLAGANAGKPSLRANLIDITGLDVAAPAGSLDVLFDTSLKIELGNAKGLRTGRSLNSVAAGNVSIRSTAGSIVVLDGPLAGGNARSARVATLDNLGAARNGVTLALLAYNPGNPGFTASTLRGRGNLDQWLGVQLQSLRVGDRVLVKNQTTAAQNGVYSLTFMSTPSWTPTTTWTLTRAGDSDTAAEFAGNSFVSVREQQVGGVSQLGTWQITANYIPLNGATHAGATYLLGSTAVTVPSVADLQPGMIVVGPGIDADTTITAIVGTTLTLSRPTSAANDTGGSTLKFVSPAVTRQGATGSGLDDVLITGLASTTDLQAGMLVVGAGIPDDTVITRILDGSTVVISNSATIAGSAPLKFIRPFATRTGTTSGTTVTGLSTTRDLLPGMVVVGPGIPADTTIASIAVNGTTLTLSRPVSLAQAGASLKFLAASPTNFGLAPIAAVRKDVTTNIGSDDPNDTVSFVVSTNAGTNSAAGSLGKMISLRQQNVAKLGNDEAQADGSQLMDFRFSASVATDITPIRLTQELPEITKAFVIGGAPTYPGVLPSGGKAAPPLIDGSRITQTRSGRAVVEGDLVNGFVVSGSEASGAVIRNVNLGGFGRTASSGSGTQHSAAIEVRDAAGVLVRDVTLGVNEANPGFRLANGVGIRFMGSETTSGTVLNSRVFGSNDAGLVVENGAGGVTVVGSTFGRSDISNTLGARFASGVNQFGVDPVTPVRDIPKVQATRVAANRFTLPAFWGDAWRLVPGMQMLAPNVLPSSAGTRVTIRSVSTDAVTGVTTVTVAGGTIVGSGEVTFITNDPATIPDLQATRVDATTFTLPSASKASAALVYPGLRLMGQGIAANEPTVPASVASVSRNLTTGVTTVTITGGTITRNGLIKFGNIVHAELNGTVVRLPDSVNMDNLFLGQGVSGTGIAGGAVIADINKELRTISFSDDQRMTRTGFTVISFVAGGRNVVTQNRNGIALNGGATTITNSTITANTFNGIVIRGSGLSVGGQQLHHRVGTASAPSTRSNQIHSNGGWGVFFAATVPDAVKLNGVRIQGNYLGTTSLAVVSSTLSNRKGNIGHVPTGVETAFAGRDGSLVPRAIDGIDPSNNQHGRYQGAGGGSGGGSGGVR